MRILYAAGPGNVIAAHRSWRSGKPHPTEVSVTYSGQFADFCSEVGATARIVSSHPDRQTHRDDPLTLEHRPKLMTGAGGIRYHVAEVLYGLGLVATALRMRADVAVVSSGTTHPFVLSAFRLFGIRVVPVLHNTLQAKGAKPSTLQRIIARADGLFFRHVASAAIGVSPECVRQATQAGIARAYLMLPQFNAGYFSDIPSPPAGGQFRVLCATRVERNKGVFDLLDAAAIVEQSQPAAVAWDICGDGAALAELARERDRRGLQAVVTLHGWTAPLRLREILGSCRVCIVPTRSDFAEGMARTAIEGVLAGRPVVTSAAVPALEVLRPACLEAEIDNSASLAACVVRLVSDRALSAELARRTRALAGQFLDRKYGFASALAEALQTESGSRVPSSEPTGSRII